MHLLLFDHPQAVSREELRDDLLLLPAWRREKALQYRCLTDQVLCAKAYLLLRQGLAENYGITNPPDFVYGRNGKPFLKDFPEIHFNLSHCRQGVLCVLDDVPVGCDIEEIGKELDEDMCRFCCSDGERAAINAAADPCLAFTRLWTMKEAALKLSGEGLCDHLPALFDRGGAERFSFLTRCCPEKAYVYTVCSSNILHGPQGSGR